MYGPYLDHWNSVYLHPVYKGPDGPSSHPHQLTVIYTLIKILHQRSPNRLDSRNASMAGTVNKIESPKLMIAMLCDHGQPRKYIGPVLNQLASSIKSTLADRDRNFDLMRVISNMDGPIA